MASFVGVPAIYPKLLEIRKSKTAEFKPSKHWKESMKLRYYQVVGALHFMLLERMVLGDGTGLGKCVSWDTLVPTSEGFVRIGDLLPTGSAEGDFHPSTTGVLSLEGPRTTSHVYDSGLRDGLKITTRHGYSITGLPIHPLLACTERGLEYRRIEDLTKGTYVCLQRTGLFARSPFRVDFNPSPASSAITYTYPEIVNADLAELLGYYVAEGCSDKSGNSFRITQFDKETHQRIRFLLKDLFGYVQGPDAKDYRKEINVSSVNLFRYFQAIGAAMNETSGGQVVPGSILKSPQPMVAAFLRGYFEGDGGVEKTSRGISCCSKSEQLIQQIQILLLSFGIVSTIRCRMVNVNGEREPYWRLYFFGRDVALFKDRIGFTSARKQGELEDICRGVKYNTNLDVVPFGGVLIKECLSAIAKHKGFSVKGSGWKGLVGASYKRTLESYAYHNRKPSITAVVKFIQTLERLQLTQVAPHYRVLSEIAKGNLFFDSISAITTHHGRFVDFTVPETHNFIGNGFVNHNTVQGLAAYAFLLERDPSLKLLIITVKSAIGQWAEEIQKFTQGISCRVIHNEWEGLSGNQARRAQYLSFKENVMILGYATVLDEYDVIRDALGTNYMVIMDEITAVKNRKAKTHLACSYLSESAKRVYGLSATIIKNGLEEVYGIYAVVVPGLFGKITHFRDKYCQQKLMRLNIGGTIRKIPKTVGYKNLSEFKTVLDPYFLCRKKEDVASELPKLISRKIELEMTAEQKQLYKQALSGILYEDRVRHEFFEIADRLRNATTPDPAMLKLYNERKAKYDQFLTAEGKKRGKLAALTYCQMISNGPALVQQPGESSKDDEFIRLVKEELIDEKVIVFSRFASGIPFLEVLCERNGLKYVKITGECSDRERDEARVRFQTSKDCNIIFITTAGSAALNLQAAGTIIFIDTPWSYGDLVQIIGRAQRIGSLQGHVLLLHLVNKGTIDVRVMNKVGQKKDLSDEILGDTAKGALDFTSNEDAVIDDLYADILTDAEAS